MAKKTKRKNKAKRKGNKTSCFFWVIIVFFCLSSLFIIGWNKRQLLSFYYAKYFNKFQHKKLSNSPFETERINKITELYSHKTFGLDISHYQKKEDILWDSLTIANGAISLDFIILRATMGNSSQDKNFEYFWKKAKEKKLICGAYHFYRPDENPVLQANSYLQKVNLEKGDLLPILDIEKLPKRKSKEQYIKDIQTWLNIVEKNYGRKPIIYTYYHFYKDYLREKFDVYPLWIANYNDVLTPPLDHWKIWQFTENGISPGVNVKIDLNIFNGSKQDMEELLLE